MIEFKDADFPISLQAQMLSLNRSALYYKPLPSSEWDLQLNRLIDITYTKHPEFGYRRLAAWLESYYGFHADGKTVLCLSPSLLLTRKVRDTVFYHVLEHMFIT